MRVVIFAGGIGTRMWPLSRVNTPKQFNPVLDNKSTLELMYQNLAGLVPDDKIFVSTNKQYVDLVSQKLPQLPPSNIFQEPQMRDLGPAVGYAIAVMNQIDPDEPVAILWSDDLIKKADLFRKLLDFAAGYLKQHANQLVYVGQQPLYADQNKGWIKRGQALKHYQGISMYQFLEWHYRPPLALAQQYFKSGNYAVNTGYFVSTPRFIMHLYQQFAPEMYQQISKLAASWGQKQHHKHLSRIYPKMEKISFDDLIVSKTAPEDAVVLMADLGWYGFGDWQSIKQALQISPNQNVTHGHVHTHNAADNLIYNYTDQLVTVVGCDELVVVNTPDALLVCHQDAIPDIKAMLKTFKQTELEKYT